MFATSCEVSSSFDGIAFYQINSIEQNSKIDTYLRDLFRSIQDDSKYGFSLATSIRQATIDRKAMLGEVCARGHPCVPPSQWNRNIFLSAKC